MSGHIANTSQTDNKESMGNALNTSQEAASVTRFGEAETSLDGKGTNGVVSAFLDETSIMRGEDSDQRGVLIIYNDALEVWSQGSGDRRRRNYFENGFVCASCYCKASHLGAVVGIGTNNGTVFLFSSDLETARRSYMLPGAVRPRAPLETVKDGDEDAMKHLQFELGSPHVPPLSELKNENNAGDNGENGYSNLINSTTVTFLSIPRENIMLAGDFSGQLHVYSLSLNRRLYTYSAINEIKSAIDGGENDCTFNMSVVDGVFIPCVNAENQKTYQSHELLAFATTDGFVVVYPYKEGLEMKQLSMKQEGKEQEDDLHPVLSVQTQKFLIVLACVTVGNGLRYLLTIHSRCTTGWLIDVSTGASQILDFEEEIVARNMNAYPTTAAYYCDARKILFIADVKGNVYIREICSSEDGNELRMRLLKKASARDDNFSVTSLNYDPLANTLLIGDSSGVVRTIENVCKNDLNKPASSLTENAQRIDTNTDVNTKKTLSVDGIEDSDHGKNDMKSKSDSPQIDVSITEGAMDEAFASSYRAQQSRQQEHRDNIVNDEYKKYEDSIGSRTTIEVKNQDVLDEYEDGDEVIRL